MGFFLNFIFRKYLLVDPSFKEEHIMDGKMVIGMNKHREICTLQMTGSMLLLKDQVCWYLPANLKTHLKYNVKFEMFDAELYLKNFKQKNTDILLIRGCTLFQILRCSNIAVVKVTELTALLQKALENDTQARYENH